jgi:capsular exopolysaccharide synthesis family protein
MGEIFDALSRAKDSPEDPPPQAPSTPSGIPGTEPSLPIDVVSSSGGDALPFDGGTKVELSTELMADWVARAVVAAPASDAASRFRHMAIRMRHILKESDGSMLAVSSANAGEGKTTTSCNLALALSSMSTRGSVALVDGDLRSPRVAAALGIDFEIGFDQVLTGDAALADARVRTQFPSLDVYPSHCYGRDAHELLSDAWVAKVMSDLATHYDAVILDCPPVLPVPDARLMAEYADACVLVVRAGATRAKALEEALGYLEHAPVAGVFVNCLDRRGSGSYYYAYGADGGK